MKKTFIACLIPAILAAGGAQASELKKIYFNQKDLPSDTQGTLQASVNLAQHMIMPTVNRLPGDLFPHLVALRKTLVIFEPKDGEVSKDEQVTVTAKNAQGETVYQAQMQPPSQAPRLVGQTENDFVVERPEVFDRIINQRNEIRALSSLDENPAENYRAVLAAADTVYVELNDGRWEKDFHLPEDPAFDGKVITFASYAGYNSYIRYSTGKDTLSRNKQLTYTNSKGKWYGKGDQAVNEIAYSDKAYTSTLPADVLTPGLTLTFTTNTGKEGLLDTIKIGANTSMMINTIDIGLLTEPRDHFLFAKQHKLQREYFQNMPISKLTVNRYEPVHLTNIVLPDGRSFTDVDLSQADHYGSDSHYRIARELISAGINTANYGVNSSYVRPNTSWNIDPPYHAVQITVNMTRGKYTNGFINHGSLGSYRGVSSVANSTGNEFSHEVGHELGIGGHYPGGFLAVHNSSTNLNSTWGWNPFSNLFVPNFSKNITNQNTCNDGQCAEPFAGRYFGKGTMSGGWPLYPEYNAYTFSPPFESKLFQDFMEKKANFDINSPTGFSKWNSKALEMEPWVNSVADTIWVRRSTISNTGLLGQFDAGGQKMADLFINNNINLIVFSMGNGYWTKNIHLTNNPAFEGKRVLVQSQAGYSSSLHLNGTTIPVHTNHKSAYQYTNGQWVEIDSDLLDKKIELTPEQKGVAVTTIVGFYDPERQLPSYIYPALHGSFGYTFADQMTASDCQLNVMTRKAGQKTFNLHNYRLTTNMMNRFHVNVETALEPYEAKVVCGDKVLDSKELNAPKAPLKFTVTSTEAGQAPEISGVDNLSIGQGQAFDPKAGVLAMDDHDGDVTASLVIEGSVNNQIAGHYKLIYKAYDSAQSERMVERVITVTSERPVISGIADVTIDINSSFDPLAGISAQDAEDGDLTSAIKQTGQVDLSTAGDNHLIYSVTDSAGQTVTEQRVITVEGEDCSNLWVNADVYVEGDKVVHNAAIWAAKWWTQGQEPGTTGEWGVWEKIASSGCSNKEPETSHPETSAPETSDPSVGEHPAYQAGVDYQAGDIVKAADGKLYQCKTWPNSGWCPSAAYAPGISTYWQDAWNAL